MQNPISDFTDEFVEIGKDSAQTLVRDVIKGIPQTAKQQITGATPGDEQQDEQVTGVQDNNKITKKVDPITGKPAASKKILTDLAQKASQLQLAKLKKIREELEKQRLNVTDKKSELSPVESAKKHGQGPTVEINNAEKQPREDAIATTLKGSKNTGEFKGLIGG